MKRHVRQVITVALALFSFLAITACSINVAPRSSTSLATNNPPTVAITSVPPDKRDTSDSISLAYDPANSSLLKANRQGLFRWRAGSSWEAVSVPQPINLSGVVVSPDRPATIYVSGIGLGVVRSDDGGKNWRTINIGLLRLDVTALALHSFRRETLYVWIKGDGMFRTEDGGANWKRVPDQGPPDKDVRGLTHSTLPGSMNTGWLYAATPTGAYLSMDCF